MMNRNPTNQKTKKYYYVDITDPRQKYKKTIINLKVKCNKKNKKTK